MNFMHWIFVMLLLWAASGYFSYQAVYYLLH